MGATAKGHLDQERSNLQSIKAPVLADTDEPFQEQIKRKTS